MNIKSFAYIIAVVVLIAGCTTLLPASSPTEQPVGLDEAWLMDARAYAEDNGVTLAEAVRRLQLQDPIGDLNAALLENEAETFAGLWIEHQPEYRLFVRFTKDGEQTLQKYIPAGSPLGEIIEVLGADVTLEELTVEERQASTALRALPFQVMTVVDVKTNRVGVLVSDPAWFEGELKNAGIELPLHADLVATDGASARDVDACSFPGVEGVTFLRQPPVEGARVSMEALTMGRLVLDDGCLLVESIFGDGSQVPIWPPEFSLRAAGEVIQVLDGAGNLVAQTGEEVMMSGGEGGIGAAAVCPSDGEIPLPVCAGPYWVVGNEVRFNLQRDAEFFQIEMITSTNRTAVLVQAKPALKEQGLEPGLTAGKLVLWSPERCPRVVSESGMQNYMLLWPEGYSLQFVEDVLVVRDAAGEMVGQEGEELVLAGMAVPFSWDNALYRTLRQSLPGDCNSPFWVVVDE